jgi:hypothetical protein
MTCYAAVRQTSAATEQLTARAVRRSPTRSDYLVRITSKAERPRFSAARSNRLLGRMDVLVS